MDREAANSPGNFIRTRIEADVGAGKIDGEIATRFPPEPNGHLHIGHAKSICLNFGTAKDFGGRCHLRFDDTNPAKESVEFQDAIKEDVAWLGFDWGQHLHYASDYFEQLYEFAIHLIERGRAYVDSMSANDIREHRGTLTEAGRESPYRNRSIEENLTLFKAMAAGEFADGTHVLRAKIDMTSPNINMRDPTLYRIRHLSHHRTGERWVIYPMYDYTHCVSDALEGITHSLCTLEFEDHRPLYDWVLDNLPVPCHPQQIEFARLEVDYTITSKRKLNALVADGDVAGWDDPRLLTIRGMRRRGYPPLAIRDFCERVGVTKKQTTIDFAVLENCVRQALERSAPRVMAVLKPLKVIIDNYPAGAGEELAAANHPKDESFGSRSLPFSREIYIEHDDFMESPPKKFFRLSPGREVRLRYAYLITCESVERDEKTGEIIAVHCRYDPESRGGHAPDGRKVKGTIHWVSAHHALAGEVRLYERLFRSPNPGAEDDFRTHLNPNSVEIVAQAMLEPSLAKASPEARFQFERLGYFCADAREHRSGSLVFNRTVTLRDTWAKQHQT